MKVVTNNWNIAIYSNRSERHYFFIELLLMVMRYMDFTIFAEQGWKAFYPQSFIIFGQVSQGWSGWLRKNSWIRGQTIQVKQALSLVA